MQYRDTGFFLNYAPRLVNLRTFAASAEVGASVAGQLLFSSLSFDPIRGLQRGMTNLTLDEPGQLRRWVIGDSFVSANGPLGGAAYLAGLSVGRAFELDPCFVSFPTAQSSGNALSASVLEVYVNGVLVRRVPISPGRFQVQNIPAVTGAGTTRCVLRDAYGREQQVVSSCYASASVLASGTSGGPTLTLLTPLGQIDPEPDALLREPLDRQQRRPANQLSHRGRRPGRRRQ